MTDQLDRLLTIMATLRHPENGCEWDRAQDFASIAPYTIEEAYEVADAIDRGDMNDLKRELGDLLLQVVFHARMAEEATEFTFADVARAISDKMEARHPHIFGSQEGSTSERHWEELKAVERKAEGAHSSMDGVAKALPALLRAEKLQKRAARDGFDWRDSDGPRAKIFEEIEELDKASSDRCEEEAGDLLFAVVNYLRVLDISPEDALREGNAKFERRYRAMEQLAEGSIAGLAIEDQEELWQKVKRLERS